MLYVTVFLTKFCVSLGRRRVLINASVLPTLHRIVKMFHLLQNRHNSAIIKDFTRITMRRLACFTFFFGYTTQQQARDDVEETSR